MSRMGVRAKRHRAEDRSSSGGSEARPRRRRVALRCVRAYNKASGVGFVVVDVPSSKGWQAMQLGDLLLALAVIGFWALGFVLVFTFVWLISRGRDNEEMVCPLSDSSSILAASSQTHTQS